MLVNLMRFLRVLKVLKLLLGGIVLSILFLLVVEKVLGLKMF